MLLLDYQSDADATDDAVTLSIDESGEFADAEAPETTTSTTASVPTTLALDTAQTADTTVAPTTSAPTTAAPSQPAPSSTEAPATTAPPVTVPPDTTPADTAPPETTPPGSTPPDTAPSGTTPPDSTPPGTAPPDTTPPDTTPPDSTPPGTAPPDTTPPETTPPDTTPPVAGPVTPVAAQDGDPTPDQWSALRECESSNNYSAVSSTGKFRGAYQFSQATWDWVADSFHPELSGEDPAVALPGNQDAMALALTRMQSPGSAWPSCSRVAGIA